MMPIPTSRPDEYAIFDRIVQAEVQAAIADLEDRCWRFMRANWLSSDEVVLVTRDGHTFPARKSDYDCFEVVE